MCKLKLNTLFLLHTIKLNSFCCFDSRKRRRNRKENKEDSPVGKGEGNEKEREGNEEATGRKGEGLEQEMSRQKTQKKRRVQKEMKLFNLAICAN